MNIKKRGKLKKAEVIVLLVSLIFLAGLVFIKADDNTVIEANFLGYGEEIISIQVPDHINLGEVNKDDPLSSEKIIRINNTGTRNLRIIPELAFNSPEVFNYTYFRKQKTTSTNDSSLTAFHKIGEYNINISKDDYETFYISLNLTDFKGNLSSNNINLNTTIKFVGMAA